ncbi:unnamed protein product [Strongylus vulgaris]|uniref:Uncharacterized protein n=1 Tax=Strongylus vulgaris TaxID=40348 RepID=A0A3P7IHR5_STRVU|nr:unnamed protein product [Strongylus vulgaris]
MPYTVESAQAVAAGLYPAEGERVWTTGGLSAWQPFYISITNVDAYQDIIFRPAVYDCPPLDSKIANERKIIKKNFEEAHRSLLTRLGSLTGLSPLNFFMFVRLYGIQTEIDNGLPQPEWLKEMYEGKEMIDWIREAKTMARMSYFNTKEKARVR